MTPVQPVRGTQSLLGEDADRMAAVVAAFDRVRRAFRFRRVQVPILENTAVFSRSIGETTDVVSKEMYTFTDRGGDSITLRPEFTAGICRAFLSEGWQQHAPIKVATHGSAFRYERPQKGRFREFHQLDAEIIGASEASADVELLAFASQLLGELGIRDVTLELNTLGDRPSRQAWSAANTDYFTSHSDQLSSDSKIRLEKNVLRILDSKDEGDRSLIRNAPKVDDFLTTEARDFYEEVKDGLRRAGIEFTENPRLVRGLDYYTHTTFEFVTDQLGAQGTVLAGGRYDGLIEALGGPKTPAVGWAAGIERLAMLRPPKRSGPEILAIVPESEAAEGLAQSIAFELRKKGIIVDYLYRGSAKKRLERYQRRGLTTAVFVDVPSNMPGVIGTINIKQYRSMAHSTERRIARNLSALFDVIERYKIQSEELLGDRRFDFVLREKREK
jgi:histidyl-tRNA synthetase